MQDVVGRHHQHTRFQLRFQRQRNVNRHLVAVEVGIERGANERMQLNSLAFDQHGLERLNTEPMQGGRAVQQHGMLSNHLIQYIPHLGTLFFDQPFRALDGRRRATLFQLVEDERLEQLQCHLLR